MNPRIYIYTTEKKNIYEHTGYINVTGDSFWGAVCETVASIEDDDCITGFVSEGYYFLQYDMPVSDHLLNEIFASYDVVIPHEGTVTEASLRQQYVALGGDEDGLNDIRRRIESNSHDYLSAFDFVMNGRMAFTPGQLITRRYIWNEYIDWITMALGINPDDYRLPEIIVSWLFKVFLIMHPFRVRSLSCEKRTPDIWNISKEKISLTKQYIETLLGEYISLRRQTGFGIEPFIEGFDCEDDFDGKSPVWMCWWQGEDEMPELVRVCFESIKRNLPESSALRLITFDNYDRYVIFSPTVISKFNNEKISMTHLTDILRTELLYRYGGMWIDATYFVSGRIPESIFDGDFYTTRFVPPLWEMDIMNGRWNSSLLAAKKESPLMQFMLEAWLLYWELTDELVNYFTFDYILNLGYEKFECIREHIDGVEPIHRSVYDMQLTLNQRWRGGHDLSMDPGNVFYKLNRRNEPKKYTDTGDLTVYGRMYEIIWEEHGEQKYAAANSTEDCSGVYTITEETIGAMTVGQLFESIREFNPHKIRDVGMNLAKKGLISLLILPDTVFHDMEIYGTVADDEGRAVSRFPIYKNLYDQITILPD